MASGKDDTSDLNAIFEQAKHGSREAFGRLYDLLVDEIYRFIYFKVYDEAVAQDITAEAFRRVLSHMQSIRSDNIRAYMYTVARNVFIDLKRKDKRLLKSQERVSYIADTDRNVDDAVFEHTQIKQCIQDLPDHYAEVVTLRFIEDHSIKRTAAIMNKSEGSIRVLQHRAIEKLKDLLDHE